MDHVNEACEVRHMSVGGLPRCVALMVVPVMPSVMAV